MGLNLGSFASIRKRFADTFNRTDSASEIGRSSDGSLWSIIRGTWGISTNRASTSSAASSYPLATIDMPKQNVTIDLLDTANGTGAALWVTDSGNWWGLAISQESVTTFSTCSGSNCNAWTTSFFSSCNAWTTNCSAFNTLSCPSPWTLFFFSPCNGGFNTSTCSSFNATSCNRWNAGRTCNRWNTSTCATWNSSNCISYGAPIASCTGSGEPQTSCASFTTNCTGWTTSSSSSCSAFFEFTFACNPVTTYPVYIRLFQSISNTVSQVASTTLASMAQSLKITTSGTQITTKAYSDTAQVTQIGSDWVYTATGASVTPKYGIVVAPTNYNQGSTIGDITIS